QLRGVDLDPALLEDERLDAQALLFGRVAARAAVRPAFARGEPDVEIALVLGDQVENFLDTMWRRFGAKDMEQLNKLCQETEAYTAARSRGHRAEIPLRDMQKAYAPSARPIPQTAGPKVMRSHDGRPVTVKSWAATLKPASPLKRK
ncbi:MAG: hypothetical protein ACPGO3_15920, partial [Magnetospiraceae bacterium]